MLLYKDGQVGMGERERETEEGERPVYLGFYVLKNVGPYV